MSLNEIKLSPFLVKKLYEKTLVVSSFAVTNENNIEELSNEKIEDSAESKLLKTPIKFLGKNNKNILIIVFEKDHIYVGEDELSFLMSVLSACNITLEDAALVNSFTDSIINDAILTKQFTPSIILFIGTDPQTLGFPIQIPMYQVQLYNKQQFLCTPSLQKLAANKEEKKLLWTALKKIFSIE